MISTRIHGALDYIVGVVLIAAPWLFNFAAGGAETWIPVVLGTGTILYSLITNYECGVVGLISMRTHLVIDIIAGIFLALSPWLFGFAELVWAPHLTVGLLMLGSGLMTRRIPERTPDARMHQPVHHP